MTPFNDEDFEGTIFSPHERADDTPPGPDPVGHYLVAITISSSASTPNTCCQPGTSTPRSLVARRAD